MARDPRTLTRALAELASGLRFEQLPGPVVERTKDCILDLLGVALRGATLPHVQPALRLVEAMEARTESTIVYHGSRTVASYAAYANAAFGHSCEFDPAHAACGHPVVTTVPVALALGERLGLSGQDVIESVVAGYETMVRLCRPIFLHTREVGWHATKLAGVFAATATAARALGLGVDQMQHAFAIASSEASGTMEYDQAGGEVKRLHPAMAVRSGIEAALLAADGMTGPPTALEGVRGIYRLFGDGTIPTAAELSDGAPDQVLRTMFKLAPAGGAILAPIDALTAILEAEEVDHRAVTAIEVQVAPFALAHGAAIPFPTDAMSAQYSLAFSLALRLVLGRNELELYLDPASWVDPALGAAASKVVVVTAEGPVARDFATRVTLRLDDGRALTATQTAFRGHPDNPASRSELQEKFRLVVPAGIDAERVIGLAEQLDELPTIGALVRALVVD